MDDIVEQGSAAWHKMRVGKVTASRVADVVRKTRSGISASRSRYMGELIVERLTGAPNDSFKSADMQHGSDNEAGARDAYAVYSGQQIALVPFVDHPRIAMSGASPDVLVGDDGLAEIKCPATHTHILTLLDGDIDADYLKQMQWQMACTNRQWCDFVSYDPRMPDHLRLFVRRIERDEASIRYLESEVEKFIIVMEDTISKLMQRT